VSNTCLLVLPNGRSFQRREFEVTQRAHLEKMTEMLVAKNIEVERAVDDLIDLVLMYPLDPEIAKPGQTDVLWVKLHYCHQLYHSVLTCVRNSTAALKRRIYYTGTSRGFSLDIPLFEVDAVLQVCDAAQSFLLC